MNNCSICKKKFPNMELLQSSQDDYFCKECFKYEYCSHKQLCTKKKLMSNKYEGDAVIKGRKMFSLEELSSIKRERTRKHPVFTSKRPLQCPHVDCNKYVSVFDLTAHFQYEHMDVRIARTTLETRNPLILYPKDIRYGVKQCLILLNVLPAEEELNNTTTTSQPEKPKLPLTVAVIASRLATAQLGNETQSSVVEEEEQSSMMFSNNDKIMIWMASNIFCNYSYTVAVSTVSEDIRVKYYGPILQLGNSCEELYMKGHCLILSHFHFLGMSENGTKPLHLDVIVHSED